MAPPKKAQNQKMSLGDFLNDESLGSWAEEEMDSMPLGSSRTGYGDRRITNTTDRYGSGFSDRPSFARDQLPLPDKPPYTAHVGNLSFEVTQSDVSDFFADCSVTSVRIVEDRLERKPKGFGYVEFATLDGLKKALAINGAQLSGRNVRVSVAEPPKDRPEARDISDWTRKGPLPSLPSDQRRTSHHGYGSRNPDTLSDAGSDRGDRRRNPFDQGDGRLRDLNNWERKGPLTPLTSTGPDGRDLSRPGTREGIRDRRPSPAWGEGRSQEGSRPPRKEFQDRPAPERLPTAPEMDNQWRARMRPDGRTKSATPPHEGSDPPSPAAPSVRPKLQLQKRTVSEADSVSPGSTASDAKASPFGAARPIDTSAREKEVEERRQLALRRKKEHDEKAREEKRVARDAARAEKSAAAPVDAESGKERGEEGGSARSTTNSIEASGPADPANGATPAVEPTPEAGDEEPNGVIVEDKEFKPKEIVRNMPSAQKIERPPSADPGTTSTGDVLEGDGWSTVSKSKNNRRGMHQASRAIAS